jgi:NDP-sugar pyrophosphorylase family protein
MKAIILTGGLGTRMRPLTFSIPKPLVPVGEKAILQLLLERLAANGVTEAILCTGYLAELIRAFGGDGSRFGLRCSYVHETEPLGTAGPLSLVRGLIEDGENFLLINGDVVTTIDFSKMIQRHESSGRVLTVGYTNYTYTSPFGVLEVEGDTLRGIREKPVLQFPISCGIYAVSSRALDLVPAGQMFGMPDLMKAIIAQGNEVGVYYVEEYWHGVESMADLELAAAALK